MGLRVWLPLDGTLENKGLSQVTVTNSGADVNASGKIGSCYQNDSDGDGIVLTDYMTELKTYSTYSMCAWIYMSSTASNHSSTILSSGNWNSSNGNLCFGFYSYSSGYSYLLIPQTAGWNANAIYLPQKIQLNAWYHVTVTYDGTVTTAYVNGEQVGTKNAGGICQNSNTNNLKIGAATYTSIFTLKGKYNDIRIYDHCLSPKEVKEISQGLVLHYKLDDPYLEPTVNLLGSKSNYFASGWSSYGFGGHGVKSIADEAPAVSGQVCRVTSNGTGTNQQIEMATSFTGPILEKNEKITASVYVKGEGESIGKMGHLHIYNTNGTNTQSINIKSFTFTADWQRVEGTFTWRYDTASRAYYNIYVVGHINNGESFLFSNVQVEEKDHATPFTVGSRNDVKVYDCSGYENDGTITGSITADSDTARYDSSTKFPDSACAIGIGNLTTLIPTGVFTFNIWFKKNTGEWSSKSWETILGGPSGFELEGKLSGTQNAYVHPYSWGGGSTTTPNSYSIAYELDTWNMLTMVRNETGTKFYLNGEWKVNGSGRGAFPSGDYFIGAWKTAVQQNFRGHFSDARIYSTALSDEDIKELYNTPANIDNHGNMHTFEFVEDEVTDEQILKTGLTKADMFVEKYFESLYDETDAEFTDRAIPSAAVGDVCKITSVKGKSIVWNQLVDTGTTSVTIPSGHKYYAIINGVRSVGTSTGVAIAVTGGTDSVFDLTQMFGSTIAATMTAADFEALYPLPYYDYNPGELVNNTASGVEMLDAGGNSLGTLSTPITEIVPEDKPTVKLNQLVVNEDISKSIDGAKCTYDAATGLWSYENLTRTTKFISGSTVVKASQGFSAGHKIYIWADSQEPGICVGKNNAPAIAILPGTIATVDRNGYYFFLRVTKDYDFVTAHPIGNVFQFRLMFIDLTEMYGAGNEPTSIAEVEELIGSEYIPYNTGEDIPNRIFPVGMKSAGSVSDEWSGTTATKRIGVVDMGTLNWLKLATSGNNFRFRAELVSVHNVSNTNTRANMTCIKYQAITPNESYTATKVGITAHTSSGYIFVNDPSYTDAASFKAAMQGVLLYYELADPVTYTVDALPDTLVPFDAAGTQRRLPVDTSEEVAAPMVCDLQYGEKTNKCNLQIYKDRIEANQLIEK